MRETTERTAPLLVTGLPRCGSSWVGQVLSRAPGVRYRYESLNPDWAPSLRGRLAHFRYLRPGDPAPHGMGAPVASALRGRQSARQWARAAYRGYALASFRRRGRLVLKDPTACLLAAWLQERHGCEVAVLVRHPCGFASSIHALDWPVPLERLLVQWKLGKDHLDPWRDRLEHWAQDPWTSLGAFWAATHHVLRRQAQRDWLFVAYENLCLHPAAAFDALGDRLGLSLQAPTAGSRHRDDPGSTRKDSRRMAAVWRERLSPTQIDGVMEPVKAFGLLDLAEAGLRQSGA